MNRWLFLVLLLPVSLSLMGAGKQAKSNLITVHMESSADEAPKFAVPVKLGTEMRQYYFKRVPELTDDDIAYFYPFISEDGATYGAGFKLTPYATTGFKALTLTHPGKLLGIRVPNAPYTAVMIDRPVEDGVFVIWEGLSKAHLKAFGKKFPHAEQVAPAAAAARAAAGDAPPPDPGSVSLPR